MVKKAGLKFEFRYSGVSFDVGKRPSLEGRGIEVGVPFSVSRLMVRFGVFTAWKDAGVKLTGVKPPELTAVKPEEVETCECSMTGAGFSGSPSGSLRDKSSATEALTVGDSSGRFEVVS